ncbi:MAG: acyl carrier protein [Clostridia bacterium]|nr:acyl carrier protein [Clostridia bacterium]
MVFDTIKEILADQLELDPEEITLESDFVQDLGADSLDLVDLVMSIEDEFGVEVPDEAIEGLTTVGDAVKFIQARTGDE